MTHGLTLVKFLAFCTSHECCHSIVLPLLATRALVLFLLSAQIKQRYRMENTDGCGSFFPSRLVDLPVSFSPSQPKTDRGGLSITCHLPAQTSRPVFLLLFSRFPATTQDSQGDTFCSLRTCVVHYVQEDIVQTAGVKGQI